jgi:hypothetical protein
VDNTFLAQPRVRRTRAVVAVGAVALLLAVAVLVSRHTDHRPPSGAHPAGAAPAAGSSVEAPQSAPTSTPDTASPPSPTVKLVAGARQVNRVAVGYPHTIDGAVSAANEYAIQLGSTLDSGRAVAIGQAINDPASGDSLASFAQGPMNSRRKLSLPVSGATPLGASISLGPVSYQLRPADRDHVTVLLLGYLTTITASQGMTNLVGVFPCPLIWSGGDWKLTKLAADADYSRLRLAPGSTEAVAAGWLSLTA